MSHPRSLAITFCALGALSLMAACRPTPSDVASQAEQPIDEAAQAPNPEAETPITGRIATGQPPGSLDPARVSLSDTTARDLVENLYVGLTHLDPEANSVAPALASEWSVSSDGTRWTFELRNDIMWVAFDPDLNAVTALRPVTADDVVYGIWRACDPATNAPHVATLLVIRGCREIADTDPALVTEKMLSDTISAVATSPTRVSIALEHRAAHFLSLTATPIMRPVAREAFADDAAEWRDAGLTASSGPWVVTANTPESMTLVANPEWPIAREGNLEAVELRFTGDEAAALAAWQAGEADLAPVSGQQAPDGAVLRVEPRVAMLVFAMDQFPTNDERVRRALASSIDRQRIVDEVLGGQGLALAGLTPPGSVAAPPGAGSPATSFDPEFARRQMEVAGYPNCQLFPRLTLMTDRSAQSLALAQAYVRMWRENLHCNDTRFDIEQGDMRLVLENINTPLAAEWQTRPQITMLTWQADYPDADNWLSDLLHCEHGYLQVGRPCDTVDDLIDRASREPNPDARAALHAEIEALFLGQDGIQPIAPIYTDAQPLAVQPRLVLPTASAYVSGPARYDRWMVNETP